MHKKERLILESIKLRISATYLQVAEITKAFRWAPFLPIQIDDSMLTVLLLLSKFRLRRIPVVNHDEPT